MMEVVSRNWKALTTIGVILFTGATGGTWAYQLENQVVANSNWIDTQEFIRLDNLRRARGLDQRQHFIWCQLGMKIGALKFCPPWRPGE